ncbi:MAG: hypothetical protein GY718_09300 [Lentisphaerae bacterium]|nr:hypothetical protein [Lentisphaerota bacterium]
MANLIAIKFQAGLHTEDTKNHKAGHAKYPDFNKVSLANRNGMDWCKFIDAYGIGMQYDKGCGHKNHSLDSPVGEQCCVIAVPEAFATEALRVLPGLVKLTPEQFEDFYDNKAHAHEDDEHVDKDVLETIATKETLNLPVPEKVSALDPRSKAKGIRENVNKTWRKRKAATGFKVV